MTNNYLTLTRADLYDMVWKRPITQVAQDFGISDVALAKRCKAVDVPVPPRGYWARVAAGQTPPKTPLPKYRTPTPEPLKTGARVQQLAREVMRDAEEPTVHFGLPAEKPAPREPSPSDVGLPDIPITATTDLTTALPVVRRLAKHLKLPGRTDIPLAASERTGPMPRVNVSPDALARALCFLDTLLRAAGELGWQLVEEEPEPPPDPYDYRYRYGREPPPPKPRHAELLVDGERLGFHIEERYQHETREPTDAEKRRMAKESWFKPDLTTAVPTGHLRFIRHETAYPAHINPHTWYDRGSKGIEAKIPRILAELREAATQVRNKRLKHEEEQRQRRERERLEAELAERREANQKLVADLERQAGAWHRARYLRRYVRAARRTLGADTWTVELQGQPTDFLAWAERYVDQLDPLTTTPRDPELAQPQRPYYGVEESTMKNALLRLVGAVWDSSRKLAAADTDVPDSEPEDDSDP